MNTKFFAVIFVSVVHQVTASTLVTKSINKFVTRIDKIITHNNEFSSVTCPFNLHLGLSLLYQGAGGKTAKELSSLLVLPEKKQEIASSYKSLLDKLTGVSFKTWTCMIPGENFDLNQDFVGTAYKYFKTGAAGASQVDNGTEHDVTLKYCNNIGSRPRTTKLQIFSKAGFSSSWKKSFPPAEEKLYSVTPGGRVKINMMILNDIFAYKKDTSLGAKVLKLDYKEEGWSMVLVLPDTSDAAGLGALQHKIEESPLTTLLQDLKETELEVTIPKFNTNAFNFHRDVKFLEKMGAKALFSNEADFRDVSNGGKMHLSHMLIEAFISVNETGTLAGSGADFLAGGGDDLPQLYHNPQNMKTTTSTNTTRASPPESTPGFKANRPFIFYIVGPSDVFLYSGKIVNPTNQKL